MQNNTQKQVNSLILTVVVNNTVSFGTDLYKWRKAKGFTQQDLALAAGVNVSYISNLERNFSASAKGGKPQPSLALVDKLAKILEVGKDKARLAAGYAPESAPEDSHDILEVANISFHHKKLTKSEQEKMLEMMKIVAAGILAEKEKE